MENIKRLFIALNMDVDKIDFNNKSEVALVFFRAFKDIESSIETNPLVGSLLSEPGFEDKFNEEINSLITKDLFLYAYKNNKELFDYINDSFSMMDLDFLRLTDYISEDPVKYISEYSYNSEMAKFVFETPKYHKYICLLNVMSKDLFEKYIDVIIDNFNLDYVDTNSNRFNAYLDWSVFHDLLIQKNRFDILEKTNFNFKSSFLHTEDLNIKNSMYKYVLNNKDLTNELIDSYSFFEKENLIYFLNNKIDNDNWNLCINAFLKNENTKKYFFDSDIASIDPKYAIDIYLNSNDYERINLSINNEIFVNYIFNNLENNSDYLILFNTLSSDIIKRMVFNDKSKLIPLLERNLIEFDFDYYNDIEIFNIIKDNPKYYDLIKNFNPDFLTREIEEYLLMNGYFEKYLNQAFPRLLEHSSLFLNYCIDNNIKDYIFSFNKSIYTKDLLDKIFDNKSFNEAVSETYHSNYSNIINLYIKYKNIDIPNKYLDVLDCYSGDIDIFINNFEIISKFFNIIGINEDLFIQYGFGTNNDWLEKIISIFNNKTVNNFRVVKDYMFKNYYKNEGNDIKQIEDFLNLLDNYSLYYDVFNDLIDNNIELNDKDISDLRFLFNFDGKLPYKPENIDDVNCLMGAICNDFIKQIKTDNRTTSFDEMLSNLLFGISSFKARNLLYTYGSVKDLERLKFNNRTNSNLCEHIDDLIILTSILERIVNIEDSKELVLNLINNINLCKQIQKIFLTYESRMRDLYEHDLMDNLTDMNRIKDPNKLIDKDRTERYGVPVFDYRTSKYNLLAHVKSPKESFEQLALGLSNGKSNFICLSAISDRYERFYRYGSEFILGYDNIPTNSFLASSVSNMGSNGYISDNSIRVGDLNRTQRGFLTTSNTGSGYNNELLCLREGVKPKYLILPDGREPLEEEIEFAKKYGLNFVLTQKEETYVENPADIEMDPVVSKYERVDEIRTLNDIIGKKVDTSKIAIITDIHGLYEPTLAILEDCRRKGITEIYSLGDDIGTGPNPSEVLDLLKAYNVKSIKGNHEIYTLLGIEPMIDHLNKTGAVEEAKRNSDWTRSMLREDQIRDLSVRPECIDLIVGNKKVRLVHSLFDYNTGEQRFTTEGFDQVIQGHIHFESENGNLYTARGAGIGGTGASYLVLEERDGEIIKTPVELSVDSLEMLSDINTSTLPEPDKNKIESWTNTGGLRR